MYSWSCRFCLLYIPSGCSFKVLWPLSQETNNRLGELATRNGIINDRSSLSFTGHSDSHMAWPNGERSREEPWEQGKSIVQPPLRYTSTTVESRGTINEGSFYLGGNTSPFPWPRPSRPLNSRRVHDRELAPRPWDKFFAREHNFR